MNIRVFMVLIPKRYICRIGAARANSLAILCALPGGLGLADIRDF